MFFASGAVGAAPRVVVSIGPVHSLVAGVMRGVGVPALLVKGGGSPHDQALRPSQARLLQAAELIFWVGPALEKFLNKPVRSLGSDARIVTLMRTPGIVLLPMRGSGTFNPHIWLGPENALATVAIAAAELSALDPANAGTYRRNAAIMVRRIDALAAEIETMVAAVKTRPYMVLHDAFSYFEDRFGMNNLGPVMVSPDQKPGARRLAEIRRRIVSQGVVCVFDEPQMSSTILRSVVAGTPARTGIFDPLGVTLAAGPDAYFSLMRGIARSLADCLGGERK